MKGYDELYKKFMHLDDVVQTNIVNHVNTQTKKIQAEAKLLCPTNTGELRNSIQGETTKTEYGAQGRVFTNKSYAPYVELGTGPTGQSKHEGVSPNINVAYSQKGWSYFDEEKQQWVHTNGQPAQPFLYPSLKNNENRVANELKEDIKKDIEKEIT